MTWSLRCLALVLIGVLAMTTSGCRSGAASQAVDARRTDGGFTASGELTRRDPELPGRYRHYDLVRFPAEPGQTIEIRLHSASFAPHLTLVDPAGEQIATTTGGMGYWNAAEITVVALATGEYVLFVTSAENFTEGPWEADITVMER